MILSAILASAMVLTEGWENVAPCRSDISPAKVLGKVELSDGGGIELDKRGGAQGFVTFSNGVMSVVKANDKGCMVIKAPPMKVDRGKAVRVSAETSVQEGDYFNAQISLRAHGERERLCLDWKLDCRYFSMGGAEEMQGAVNSAPGMFYRKYAHLQADDGIVTPILIVGGSRSRMLLRDWIVEDLDAADAKWTGFYEAKTAKDRSSERISDADFSKILAADADHTAKLEKIDGITRFIVDGKVSVPVAYRSKGSFGKDALFETFACKPIADSGGVRIVVKSIKMGGGFSSAPRQYWTKSGYDAKGAAKDIRDSLRVVPDALCILGISCNAYPEFTLEEHPNEVWRLENGGIVRGTAGSCVESYDDMGIKDTNRWPWVSYASPAWRNAVKANIRALLKELRAQGLDKRIIGVQFSGYHDGQFYSPFEDHSVFAKAEYERYLKDCPVAVKDYSYFSKLLGFRAQEDFAREFKRAIGKDVVAIRWCMGPFAGAMDLTAFAYSDAIDICIPQPTYETRRPAMAVEPKLPFSSFNLHGKMYWNEFDLRTYAALESWAAPGVVATKGLGQSDDFEMWRTVYRKLAGMMIARHCGYWFYDMAGGWFSAPEIAHDIGKVREIERQLLERKPSVWRAQVAVVGDERGLSAKVRPFTVNTLRRQLMLFAASGVPYEFYLAEDVIRNPSLLKDSKTVVFAFMRNIDSRRRKLIRELENAGRTLVYLYGSGEDGGMDATGFSIVSVTNSMPHAIVAAEGVQDDISSMVSSERRRIFPEGPSSECMGPRSAIKETPGMKVLGRYASDGAAAIAVMDDPMCRRVYVAEPAGLSPGLFNRLARESGAYVPVAEGGLEVDMSGDFLSVHALRNGEWDFTLPFSATAVNLKSGETENTSGGKLRLRLTAGQTAWFSLFEAHQPQ